MKGLFFAYLVSFVSFSFLVGFKRLAHRLNSLVGLNVFFRLGRMECRFPPVSPVRAAKGAAGSAAMVQLPVIALGKPRQIERWIARRSNSPIIGKSEDTQLYHIVKPPSLRSLWTAGDRISRPEGLSIPHTPA